MPRLIFLPLLCILLSCKEGKQLLLTAQEIVDKSIEVSGSHLLKKNDISFEFRNILYKRRTTESGKVLERVFKKNEQEVRDVFSPKGLQRYVEGAPVFIADSTARKYQNSINSVHYFAYLPEGLNDGAVQKKLVGETKIKDSEYYVIEITFKEEGGGDDFDDIYLYWIDKQDFKIDYLAYEFSVNEGGIRFREAYNERYINGIRFVDYKNYGEDGIYSVYETEDKFKNQQLPLKSKIILEKITVSPDNYN